MGTRPDIAPDATEELIDSAISASGRLGPSEIAVHFDLVVVTRQIDDEGVEHIRRHHWTRPGSDPHLSVGVLRAQAKRILRRIL